MPRITIIKEKTGQIKYKINLPKDIMEALSVQKGDKLNVITFMGDTITFKLERQK